MQINREEIFGPVLVCLNAATLDDAMALINANEYGNGTAIFTRSGAAAARFQREVEAGQVGVNRVLRADGSQEDLGHIAQVEMQAGDVFEIHTPGGGGFGPA